jgi:hypothetical protein
VVRHTPRSGRLSIMGLISLSILSCSTSPGPPKGQVRRRVLPGPPSRGSTAPSLTGTPKRVGWKDMRPIRTRIKIHDSTSARLPLRLRINQDHFLRPTFPVLERYLHTLWTLRRS